MAATKSPDGLNDKQRRFVAEYVIDFNATNAAIRAGYSKNSADVIGCRLLTNVKIAQAVKAKMDKQSSKLEITAERVLLELARLAFSDHRKLYNPDGTLKAPHEIDDDTAAAVSSVEVFEEFQGQGAKKKFIGYNKKSRLWDKNSALDKLGRRLGLWNEKHEHVHSGSKDNPIHLELNDTELTDDERLDRMRELGERIHKRKSETADTGRTEGILPPDSSLPSTDHSEHSS